MRLQHKAFELFADFHQFYLWDRGMDPEAPEDYTEEDVRLRIKTGPYVVVIQTERNMTVAVEVEIHDAEPPCHVDGWDHVVEASLHLPTGQLEVQECSGGPVADFGLDPGWYRVRSHHGGFGTIDESGLEGDDRYLAVLWPATPAELRVIKQWAPKSPD